MSPRSTVTTTSTTTSGRRRRGTEDELEFCYKAISNNPNLRAVREVSSEVVSQLYAFAWRRASALVKRLGR